MSLDLLNIRTGDLIYTTLHELSNYLVLVLTGSITNHITIALWISQKGLQTQTLDILPYFEPGAKLYLLEMSRSKTKDFRQTEKKNGMVIVDFEDVKTRIDRAYYRPLSRKIPDDEIIDKIKKFIEREKDCVFSIGALHGINFVLNWGKIDHDQPYPGETCVSFVIKWLLDNGYSFDEKNTPVRSRHLHTPDHLLFSHNQSRVFENAEVQFYQEPKPRKFITFVLTMIVLVILIITLIICLVYLFNGKLNGMDTKQIKYQTIKYRAQPRITKRTGSGKNSAAVEARRKISL